MKTAHEMVGLIRIAPKANPHAEYKTLADIIELGKHEIRGQVDEDTCAS